MFRIIINLQKWLNIIFLINFGKMSDKRPEP